MSLYYVWNVAVIVLGVYYLSGLAQIEFERFLSNRWEAKKNEC